MDNPDEVVLRDSMKQRNDTSRGRDIFAIETDIGEIAPDEIAAASHRVNCHLTG